MNQLSLECHDFLCDFKENGMILFFSPVIFNAQYNIVFSKTYVDTDN